MSVKALEFKNSINTQDGPNDMRLGNACDNCPLEGRAIGKGILINDLLSIYEISCSVYYLIKNIGKPDNCKIGVNS